jgi:PAS domain S-box-containing protein
MRRMQPAVLPPLEAQRLARLRATGVLDTPPEPAFDALVAAAARITACPIALVSLVDAQRQWFKARQGLAASETHRDVAFCAHAILDERVFVVPNALEDPRFADNPLVQGEPDIRFYAGAPIEVEGQRLGTLCVIDTTPRTLPEADLELLAQLARTASDLIRRQQQDQVHALERERLIDFARAGGDWTWETDAQARYTWVSPSVDSCLGLPAEALAGRSVLETGLPEPPPDGDWRYHEGLMAEFAQALNQRRPASRLIVGCHAPKGYLYLSFSFVPLWGEGGRFAGYRGSARDVTVQVRGMRRAQVTDARLRELAAQVPGGLLQVEMRPDFSVHYHFVSEQARTLLDKCPPVGGSDAPECVQVHVVLPQDLPPLMATLGAACASLSPVQAEYRVQRADGSITWVENRGTPQRLPNGHIMWHTFLADISARKQVEQTLAESQGRLSLAAEVAGLGIGRIDLEQGQLTLDAQARRNHGLSVEADSISMQDYMGALHPEERGPMQQAIASLAQGGPGIDHTLRVCGPDGRERQVELVCRPVRDAQGRTTAVIGLSRDVTETRAAASLRLEREAALRASQAKSEFLSRVSHELRTPLNAILGFAQLMEIDLEHPLPSAQRQRLERLQLAGNRLLDLINDVLDLGRIESGAHSFQSEPVDVARAVGRCLQVLQPLAVSALVQLPEPPQGPVWAMADSRALEQVVLNLISNAIKYNRRGGTVRLSLKASPAEVVLTVEDEGPGLSPELRARLFEPFNRLGAENSAVPGSGLGLVISRELMLAMKGRIEAHSAPGQGSAFVVAWPLSAEAGQATDWGQLGGPVGAGAQGIRPAASAGAPAAAATPGQAQPGPLVLYIEDEPLNVLLLQGLFERRPHWRLACAATLQEGLQMARRLQPRLVLMDMHLPDGEGCEGLRALRADPQTRGLCCVALSADAMPEQIQQALAAGFDGYWTKPIDLHRTLEALDNCLAESPSSAALA